VGEGESDPLTSRFLRDCREALRDLGATLMRSLARLLRSGAVDSSSVKSIGPSEPVTRIQLLIKFHQINNYMQTVNRVTPTKKLCNHSIKFA
jgi:hypothetical protein